MKLESPKLDRDIDIPEVILWKNNNTILAKTKDKFQNKDIYKISRGEGTSSSYTEIKNNKVNFGKNYKISIAVKKGSLGNLFGLRIQGEYPNRVDAVFDFDTLKVKGKNVAGNFKNVKATMEPLGNGWYNCTLSGKINAKEVKILMGPTTNERNFSSWEGATKGLGNLFIIPETLTLKEVL